LTRVRKKFLAPQARSAVEFVRIVQSFEKIAPRRPSCSPFGRGHTARDYESVNHDCLAIKPKRRTRFAAGPAAFGITVT
jgi:hypothetical protein